VVPFSRPIIRFVRVLTVSLVVTGFTAGAHADTKYGLLFMGERMWSGDVRAIGLGSDFHLVEDSLSLQHNPATFASVKKFTFSICGYVSVNRGRNDEYVETDVATKLSSFLVGFPVMSRLTLGLGFRGLYDATGNFVTEKESELGEAYGEFFNRTGGLSSFPFFAAVDPARFVKLGGYFSVERGHYDNRWDIVFADPTKNTAFSNQELQMRGLGYGFGIVAKPPGGVLLGVTYEGAVDYDADITEEHTNPASNYTSQTTVRLPERWTFSASWRFHRMFSGYGTYSVRDFSGFEGTTFPQDRLFKEETAAAGFEFHRGIPLGKTRIPLRLGATWSRLPYDYPAGERITSVLFELGLGLKLRSGKGKIDLAFQGGTTGDVSSNGIEDRVFRVYLGLTGAEVWRRHRQSDF
jgi:hypothetical protein